MVIQLSCKREADIMKYKSELNSQNMVIGLINEETRQSLVMIQLKTQANFC